MVKKLFRVLALLIVLAAAVGFYGWYELGNIIESANRQLPANFKITYQDRYLDHRGLLTLSKPQLIHASYGVIASAETLTYQAENWKNYLSMKNDLALAKFPAKGTFSVHQLNVPIDALSKQLSQPSNIKLFQLLAQGCNDKTDFSLTDLVNSGHSVVAGEMELSFEFNPLDANLKLQGSNRLKDLVSYEWLIELKDMVPGSDRSPYLGYAQLVLFDPIFVNVRDNYCSKLNEQSVDEFKQKHIAAITHFLQDEGVILHNDFTTRYIEFVNKAENLAFTFTPKTGIRLNKYGELSYSNILDQLGISINMNGRAVANIVTKVEASQLENAEKQNQLPAPVSNIVHIKNPTVSQLKSITGERVTITTNTGQEYNAKILRVTSSRISLEVRSYGGTADIRLSPRNITSVEYKRKP